MLEGLKVVEFATHMAAPGAAAILADWGADVIKVETGRGDPIRQANADLTPDGVAPALLSAVGYTAAEIDHMTASTNADRSDPELATDDA